jgi:tetratricopeptide (TPR) repeat protein
VTAAPTTKRITDKPWLPAILLVILTFVVYLPALRCGFIWDDDDHLTANPAMTAPHGLRMIWSSLAVSRYYPLTLTTFWVQRRLWGLNPLPYHAVNVTLQAANAVLLWGLLRRLQVRGAWFAAAVWAVHPVNLESVAWITELKNTQSGLFFFLSVLCFLRFEEQKSRRWYAAALVCGGAAMLSKPSTVVLPLALLLCVWWERGRWNRSDMVRVVPLFVLALGMSAMTVVEQQSRVNLVGATDWRLPPAERLIIAGKAVWFYAAHVLWPANLMFVYPRWDVSADSASSWLPLAGVIAVGALLWTCRRQPWARASLFGSGFFVVALLPVLGFFNVYFFRFSFVADRFQYLACIGLISLAVSSGSDICERAGRRGRQLGTLAAAIVLLMLGVSTWRQGQIYRDSETLWRDTLSKNPGCWMAHNNLGSILLLAGRVQEAIGQCEQALQIRPNYAEPHGNLGKALAKLGRDQEAIKNYEQALQINPNFAGIHNELADAFLRQGKVPEGIEHYEQALRLKPNYVEAHLGLGVALERTGRVSEAGWHYRQALQINPNFPEALNNLAWLLATRPPAESGNAIEAVALAERASQLTNNRVPDYLDTLAAAYAAAGRFDAAVAAAQKAIDLARSAGQVELVKEIEARLELYRLGRAYRKSVGMTGPSTP